MKRMLSATGAILIAGSCLSQNLVPNPSFEDTLKCPDFVSQIDYATGWHTLVNTPDYYNECNNTSPTNTGMVGVPSNARGYQPARTGKAYAGEVNYYTVQTDYRETFYAQLLSPLQAGMLYEVGMWVVMNEDRAQWAVDGDLGIYLSSSPPNPSLIFTYVPQVSNAHGNVLNDTLNWTSISGLYTATGGEQYITIGSFIRDNQLTIINRGGSIPFTSYAIDDVWVIPWDATAVRNKHALPEITIYPNPASDEVRITLQLPQAEDAAIEVFSITGEKVIQLYRKEIYSVNENISIEDLPDGIYRLNITTSAGNVSKNFTVSK